MYIWGYNERGKIFAKYLENSGLNNVMFIDSKPQIFTKNFQSTKNLPSNLEEIKEAYELGVLHYLQKDYSSAITAFTKCLAIDNQHAYALHDRGSCYRLTEEFDKAEKDYLSAIDLNPKSFMYNNLGAIYKLKGMYAEAQQAFNGAVGIDSSNPVSYNNRGSLHYEQENYQDAFKDFEKALALNPEYALALCNRAAIYQLREQYGAALADLNKACELDKLNPSILLNRGITKEMLRDEEGACEDWSKAGELGLQQGKTYYINNCE